MKTAVIRGTLGGMIPRRILLIATALLSFTQGRAADRPNVVWIVSEDNSKHYLKLFDPAGAETPHIEKLATDGLRFTRAFSNAPVCSVARTTLATGCYPARLGTHNHRRLEPVHLPAGMRLFTSSLREAGYYTSNDSKEDYNTAKDAAAWDDSSKNASWRNRPDPAQPFFHMQSHPESHESSLHFDARLVETEPTTHDPAAVVLPPYFPDTPLFRYTKARYLDRIQAIDGIVGETVAKLEADGLLEDTFVFYFGDHGGVLPRGKGYLYESGLHVPLVVRVPEKWRQLVPFDLGAEVPGFVTFVDFAPTVLNLAGVTVPETMDGRPFLGEGVDADEVRSRNSALGSADRFDEKIDMVRSLRIGDWKYVRNYQPYQPDGIQNNYRYQMAAYREWRDLYAAGKLGSDQRAFFERKAPEALYDLANDPHETRNLADDPGQNARLLSMRAALRERLKALPDLGFLPESVLVAGTIADPVAWGRDHHDEIASLIDAADLMLAPFPEIEEALRGHFDSGEPWRQYWAATVASAFGEEAVELAPLARKLLEVPQPYVRARAIEFLGLIGEADPRATLVGIVNESDSVAEQLIALQSAALFHDRSPLAYPFDPAAFKELPAHGEPARRIAWFRDDWLGTVSPKRKKKNP